MTTVIAVLFQHGYYFTECKQCKPSEDCNPVTATMWQEYHITIRQLEKMMKICELSMGFFFTNCLI